MLKKTEKTVFVLDGLDEFKTKTSRDITDIMRGNTLKHVIVTSRPEAANKTKKWIIASKEVLSATETAKIT